ncbi:MAG TPA: hypothetical protein VMY98_03430 [Anaerolineae bacterium]|nr:hypothetical protein [Anaerolineae bacterium]
MPRPWRFERFVPGMEDSEAELQAAQQWTKAVQERPVQFSSGEVTDPIVQWAFSCGFNRGASWMQHKITQAVCDAVGMANKET